MHKGKSGIVKGLGAGMAAGVVVGLVGGTMMKHNKNVKRTTAKAARAVSDFVNNIQYMMK